MHSEPMADAADSKSSGNPILLAVWLVLRPGFFFRAWGQRAPLGWMIGACWVVGLGSMAISILNRLMASPQRLPIQIDSWAMLWVILIATGALRGLGIYWIGGAWFRARLWLSGERTKCWKRSARVYLGGRFVEQSAGVLGLVIYTFHFATLGDFVRGDRMPWLILLGTIALLWGGMVSFLGARAVFTLNAWSWLWLFALPMLWRIGIVGVTAWATFFGGPLSLESLERNSSTWREPGTFTHDGAIVNVALADGWVVTDLDNGVRATSQDTLIRWSMVIVPNDSVQDTLAASIPSGVEARSQGERLTGRWFGMRREYERDGTTSLLIDCELDTDHSAVFFASAPSPAWEDAYTDIERCMASAYVTDERFIGVDPNNMRTLDMGPVVFDVPATWIVKEYVDQDDDYSTDLHQTTINSPGQAEMYLLVYGSEQTRAESFELSWKEIGGWHDFTRSSRITTWRGVPCDGVNSSGKTQRGMPIELTLVTIERPGGVMVNVVTIHAPHEPASLLRGVRLFEQSVRFTDEPLPNGTDAPADGQP